MKSLIALAAALILASPAHAVSPKINQGNWLVGGSTSLSFCTGCDTSFDISPEAAYFVIDNVAAGLAASYYVAGSYSSLFLAPEVIFHMRAAESWIPYFTLRPLEIATSSNESARYYTMGTLGVKFFLNDSVSVGPAFRLRHHWPRGGGTSSNSGTLLGVFTIHL